VVLLIAGAACSKDATSASVVLPSGTSSAATGSQPPDPNFDSGQTIYITDAGFAPHWLVSIEKLPVVWVNDTDKVQSVVFDHQKVRSGPIQPGESFTWTSTHMVSVTYHNGEQPSQTGAVQVSQPLTGT
jgi:hypothetical protein